MDWTASFAQRTAALGGGEITAILALAGATDVITFSGGFPAPETFPTDVVTGIATDLLAKDAAVALQYSATEGLAGTRDYFASRLAGTQGRRPEPAELLVTSGGIDCMELAAKSLIDPGDVVVVEAPTYLGAIMAFRGYQADVRGVDLDDEGMRVDQLQTLLADGVRPKIVYTIPDFQNPTGLSMSAPRRAELIALARRYGFLIIEDVAYRDLNFTAPSAAPASIWSLAPDVTLQAGTCSKIFFPGVRLGWAAGPAPLISQLAVAKQNSDQCAGALGQRLFEEYGRGGHLDRQIAASRVLYARRARLLTDALAAHLPAGSAWTMPQGGFYSWVTLPEGLDTVVLNSLASQRAVAFVPGAPFYPVATPVGARQLRLSYSRVAEDKIDEGIRRLAGVISTALEES
jgi:2-aminoadipate transaminase